MKKLLALLAVVLAVVSCQKEINGLAVDSNGEAAVSLSVALPEGATRAAGADSALGAIDNGVMNNYDVRFILEVYDMSGAAPELAKERMVQSGQNTTATFNFRLVPGRDYNFVVWADFVEKKSQADRLYNTEDGLDEIEMYHKLWDAIDESRDAYTESVFVENYNGTSKIGENGVITLTRPFAKLRVVTNDIKEMISIRPKTVTVKYFSTEFYAKYNALSETPYNAVEFDKELVVTLLDDQNNPVDVYTGEKPDSTGVQTLFADYFFAKEGDRVMFTMDVEANHGPAIPKITFNTNIPVKRNNLTTVYGPILTDANNVSVTINPAFENGTEWNPEEDEYDVEMISGTKTETVVLKAGNYLFDDVTIKVADGNAIEVNGDVVIDVMGVMNLESKGGIVVNNGSLVINGAVKTRGAERVGILKVETKEGSAIGGSNITIQNLAGLTAKANGLKAFGIGAENATVVIKNTKIDYVSGGYIQPEFVKDTDYGKSEPEGGAAIGGANVTIENSEIVKAEGGSKAAAIGNRYWQNTEVIITNCKFDDVFGGNASAAIGGSRYSSDISAENKQTVKIKIEDSKIKNAVGGQFGAGIGAGYDTHCVANDTNAVNHIEIINSNITAQGGKYAAGIGTGFHSAALTGSIDAASVINATSGEKFYKNKYTAAQNIGYGIVDPAREYKDQVVTFTVAGNVISSPSLPVVGENGTIVEGLGKDIENENQYYASEPEALTYIADQVNEGNDNFNKAEIVLSNDIDLSQLVITRAAVANNWTPIGTEENPFKGSFDGKGKTIKNLALVESEAKEGKAFVGFFGYAKDATIKNVTFENVYINIPCLDIDHSQGHIGAVAGSLEGTSTIEDVTVKGDIKVYATQDANGASRVAVVAGGNSYGNVTMKNVHVIADEGSYLIANNNTGALAGQLQGKSVFENCSSNIDVTVNKFFAGGIIGLAAGDQTFTNCHTTGNIAVVAGREGRHNDEYRVGGIAGGWADGKTKVCTLTNCTYTGKVSGKNADGSVAEPLDYMGYVGRGYTLANCAGSKVIIDGDEYVQLYDNIYGVYTVNGAYAVNSAADLKALANLVNAGTSFEGVEVVLTADIDLKNENWTPIGSATAEHGFMGNFDGNGKIIKNLNIANITPDADGYVYAGLFGVTEGVDANNENYIKNLTIENVTINTDGHIVAAAVAYPYYTNLENITVKGNVNIKGGKYTAGVLAYTRRCVNAKNIAINAAAGSVIEGTYTIGGVISDIQTNGGLKANYSNFEATGLTIKATMRVGGISGIIGKQTLNGATVKNVVIESDDARTGTLCGSFDGVCEITNAVVENVTGADFFIGGLYEGTESTTDSVTINGVTYTYNNGWLVDGYNVLADGLLKKDNEYKVTNAAGLVALSGMTIKGNEVVTLGADIDLNGVEFNGLYAFNPEPNNTFDGKGFTVSNWTNNSGASDMGFFKSWVGTIKNVKFENCHLKTAGRSAIVAANTYCNIENVEVKNSSIEDSYWACGIIAGLYNAGNISNCVVTDSSVKSNGGTAAIVGVINETSGERKLTNCSVTGCTINNTGAYGDSYAGGALVGKFNAGNATYRIKDCVVSNNTLVGSHVYEKYPANENVNEE